MPSHAHAASQPDGGFTLVELLVVIIIVGILAAVAIPVFMSQRTKAADAAVVGDLKDLATAAETSFTDELTYPSDRAGFAASGSVPVISDHCQYVAFVEAEGQSAGYVIYGVNDQSGTVYRLSSYDGGAPAVEAAFTFTAGDALVDDVTGPVAGTYGATQPDLSGATAITIP